MSIWTKIYIWWVSGGNMFCGYDEDGEKMYTLNNGETLMIWLICLAGLVTAGIVIMVIVRAVM